MTTMGYIIHSLRAKRFSLFVFTLVIWGWGFLIFNSFQHLTRALVFLLPLIIAVPLLVLSILFARRLRGLQGSPLFENRRLFWFYIIVVVLTIVAYLLANSISRALNH